MENTEQKGLSLENVIATAIQIPGVKVNRELFLRENFQKESREVVDRIVDVEVLLTTGMSAFFTNSPPLLLLAPVRR